MERERSPKYFLYEIFEIASEIGFLKPVFHTVSFVGMWGNVVNLKNDW